MGQSTRYKSSSATNITPFCCAIYHFLCETRFAEEVIEAVDWFCENGSSVEKVLVFIHAKQLVPIFACTDDSLLLVFIKGKDIDDIFFPGLGIAFPLSSHRVGYKGKSSLLGKS